ncbi:Homeobox protein SIX6, partial [Vespula squamosa]
ERQFLSLLNVITLAVSNGIKYCQKPKLPVKRNDVVLKLTRLSRFIEKISTPISSILELRSRGSSGGSTSSSNSRDSELCPSTASPKNYNNECLNQLNRILTLEKRSIFQTNSSRDRSTIQLSIGFRLSTSDPLGSTIESSKPNPILIDVNERRGETIARIISGATNTIHERPRDPYRGLILYSTEGCSDGGETTVREASSSSSSSKE